MIQQQAQAYLQPTNPDPASMSAQDAQKAIATDLVTYAGGGADGRGQERIVNVMAAQMKTSHDEAAKKFDNAQAKVKQTRDKAQPKDAADRAPPQPRRHRSLLSGGAARCARRCDRRIACGQTPAGVPSHLNTAALDHSPSSPLAGSTQH